MKHVLVFLLGVCLAVLAGYFFLQSNNTNTIYVYDDRFEPDELTIDVGETIHFVSKADRPMWPASDSHPRHLIYPEFDTKMPIEAGGTWSFTFDVPGIWHFHDHLSPTLSGVITVRGDFGMDARLCADSRTGVARAVCWEEDFKELIDEEGVDAAFDMFVEIFNTDSTFRSYCHDVMHYVGRAAYSVYELDQQIIDRQEVAFCGFGFYHGFIEASLEENGTYGFSIARDYCEQIFQNDQASEVYEESYSAGACWHGVGHSVFDGLDGSYWGNAQRMTEMSLERCSSVFQDEYQRWQCSTGVFNSLATAMVNDYYELTFDKEVVTQICGSLNGKLRDSCFLDLIVGYTNANRLSLVDAIEYTLTFDAPEESRAHALFGVVDDAFRRDPTASSDPVEFFAECEKLDGTARREACLQGITIGILYSSHDQNVAKRLLDFCPTIDDSHLRYSCFERSARLIEVAVSPREYTRICTENDMIKPFCEPLGG